MRSASLTSSSWRRTSPHASNFRAGWWSTRWRVSPSLPPCIQRRHAAAAGLMVPGAAGYVNRLTPPVAWAISGGVSAERKRHRPQDHVLEDGLVHFTLLISIPAKVTSFGFHPDGRKLLSGNSIRPSWDGTSQKLPPSQCNSASHSFYEVAAAHGLDHAVMNAALE